MNFKDILYGKVEGAKKKLKGYGDNLREMGTDVSETAAGIGSGLKRRWGNANESASAYNRGEQSFGETATQITGQMVAAPFDAVGSAVVGAGKLLLPQEKEDTVAKTFKDILNPVVNSRPVQYLAEKYQESGDRTKRNLGALGNLGDVASNFTPLPFVGMAARQGLKTGAKEAAETGLKKGVIKLKQDLPKFEGFNDLTTKSLEQMKGRSEIPKNEVVGILNKGVSKPERELIEQVLSEYPDGKIPVKEFANRVKTELLPLKRSTVKAQYEQVNLPEDSRGSVQKYREHVYESPVPTSAGSTHFRSSATRRNALTPDEQNTLDWKRSNADHFDRKRRKALQEKRYDLAQMYEEESTKARKEVRLLQAKKVQDTTPTNYFGHTRVEDMSDGGTRRVIELQSDLFQKGNLEREKAKDLANDKIAAPLQDFSKLEPYENSWWKRLTREEISRASKDGKERLHFPVGKTAMEVEGLNQSEVSNWMIDRGGGPETLSPEDVRPGATLYSMHQDKDWVVVDRYEDGRFAAVPKLEFDRQLEHLSGIGFSREEAIRNISSGRHTEVFDSIGKVIENNPIHKFYEGDIGSFLQSKYGAKRITDSDGYDWWEVDLRPFKGKFPVEAFGAVPFVVGGEKEEKKKGKIRLRQN